MGIEPDINLVCELPEGHKGLHVQGTETWTGYARHEVAYWHGKPSVQRVDLSEPIETKTVTIGEAKDIIRTMIEGISGFDWPAHWRKSDEVFASPFSSHTEPSEASNKP